MTDTKSEPNYQDILDKYADSIKSTEIPEPIQPEPELKSTQEPEQLLETELTPESKMEIHPTEETETSENLDTPIITESEIKTESEPLQSETPIIPELSDQPIVQSEPPFLTAPAPEIPLEGGLSPEAINSSESPESIAPESSEVAPPKENHFFKYLFFFSLFIFIIVLISVILSFINSQKNLNSSTATPTLPLSPTDTPKTFCEINGQQYQIGESFLATDGCNKCACNADLTVVCTEMACEATPSMKLSPTSKLTPTTKISPTKIPTIIDEQE